MPSRTPLSVASEAWTMAGMMIEGERGRGRAATAAAARRRRRKRRWWLGKWREEKEGRGRGWRRW